jgi:hypothetical protein
MQLRTIVILAAGAVALTIIGTLAWRTYRTDLTVYVDAPPPAQADDLLDPMPEMPASVVEAPISYELGPAIAALEAAVPRVFGDVEKRIQAGDNRRAHFAFAGSRSPFRIDVDSLTIRISSIVEYEGRGWYKPIIGPEVSAACGTGGVPRPRVRVTLVTNARLTKEWQLRTKTRISQLEAYSEFVRDRCRVTAFRIDITNRIVEAVRTQLERHIGALDRNLARLDTPRHFQRWWSMMQRPIKLTDSIWFTINPRSAQLQSVTSDSGAVIANLRLGAAPRIMTGPRPSDFDFLEVIPPLEFGGTPTTGLRVPLEATFTYPVASSLIRKGLVGRSVTVSGRTVEVEDATLTGIGGGRVALGIEFDGAVRGTVYLTGTPKLDTLTRQIHVPDLDYDVGSADLLVRSLEWVKDVNVRDFLRERARLPDTEVLERLRVLAEKGMNRQLAPGVVLVARIATTRGLGVHATTTDLRVRALAEGEARLEISKAPPVRPRAGPTPNARRGK